MPRAPRVHVSGGLYHVILRGNHQEPLFDVTADYRLFEELLARALLRYGARVHAYCWMTNHVHMAAQAGDAPLGRLIQTVASVYARRKQRKIPTTGHLFERRYRATLVDTDAYWLALIRYIHRNPIEAGMVSDCADYRWSSHSSYLGRESPPWLTTAPTLAMFGNSRATAIAAYRSFVTADDAEAATLEDGQTAAGAGSEKLATFELESLRNGRSLEQVLLEVTKELNVDATLLTSERRDTTLVRARVEIARRALAGGVASLADVAARLGRSASTLSEQLNRNC
jgi:putative transposase